MVEIQVTGRDGVRSTIEAPTDASLMTVLQQLSDGVEAVCAGQATCGTCHVIVDAAWADRLPPAAEDEQDLIGMLSHAGPNSRLSCQLVLTEDMAGLGITLAPNE